VRVVDPKLAETLRDRDAGASYDLREVNPLSPERGGAEGAAK
jgi:hypothetical protein